MQGNTFFNNFLSNLGLIFLICIAQTAKVIHDVLLANGNRYKTGCIMTFMGHLVIHTIHI